MEILVFGDIKIINIYKYLILLKLIKNDYNFVLLINNVNIYLYHMILIKN